jgi:uncharacterized protein (TIGR03089 family)
VPADDVPGLLATLVRTDPGRPRVTWYGAGGERVELSGRTLDNWVAKTANLLVDEFDSGPGTRVAVRLPPHWRTVTWLLATWATGACVVTAADADVVVTTDPGAALAAGAAQAKVVAVALPSLATSFGPDLPDGVLDGATEVRLHGDVFVPLVTPAPGDPALVLDGATLDHRGLLAAARAAALPAGTRLLTAAGVEDAVAAVLAPLAVDGSVVLHDPALDAATLARIAEQERTTA